MKFEAQRFPESRPSLTDRGYLSQGIDSHLRDLFSSERFQWVPRSREFSAGSPSIRVIAGTTSTTITPVRWRSPWNFCWTRLRRRVRKHFTSARTFKRLLNGASVKTNGSSQGLGKSEGFRGSFV